MPETTTTQLTEIDVTKVEQRLKAWIAGDIPHTQYPASWADVDALIRDWRALQARLEQLNTLGEEMLSRLEIVAGVGKKADHGWYFVVSEIERQNAALREQLAAAAQRRQRNVQLIRDQAARYGDEEGLSRVLDTIADELENSK